MGADVGDTVETEIYHNTQPGHNKQYILRIERDVNVFTRYSLIAEWGRIGYSHSQSKVYVEDRSLNECHSKMRDLARDKMGKGYRLVSGRSPSLTRAAERSGINVWDVIGAIRSDDQPKRTKKKSLRPGAGRQVESEDIS